MSSTNVCKGKGKTVEPIQYRAMSAVGTCCRLLSSVPRRHGSSGPEVKSQLHSTITLSAGGIGLLSTGHPSQRKRAIAFSKLDITVYSTMNLNKNE